MLNTLEVINRLERIMANHNLSAASFATKIGVQRSAISHILSGRNKPSLDFLMKVYESFDEVALELGMTLTWKGKGVKEKASDSKGNVIVEVDEAYFRPTEVTTLLGDATKARKELNWKPKISFNQLVKEMTKSDLVQAEFELKLISHNEQSKQ